MQQETLKLKSHWLSVSQAIDTTIPNTSTNKQKGVALMSRSPFRRDMQVMFRQIVQPNIQHAKVIAEATNTFLAAVSSALPSGTLNFDKDGGLSVYLEKILIQSQS